MAVQQGYGKMAGANSLVFAYDTTDTTNSFKGEPTENMILDPLYNQGVIQEYSDVNNTGWGTITRGKVEDVLGPFNETVKAYSQELISYTSSNRSIEGQASDVVDNINARFYLTAGLTYTLSVWIKANYTGSSSNRLYISGTATGGDGTTREVTQQWQRINRTYTPSTSGYYYMRHYAYENNKEVGSKIWYALPQVELNSHATPFVNGTRSATEGLLDLTGNRNIDIASASFNNGNLIFDGTDDIISIGNNLGFQNSSFSLEAVIYWDGNSTDTFFGYGDGGGTQRSIHWRIYDSGQLRFDFYSNSINSPINAILPNTWYHLFVTYDYTTDTCKCYRNGELLMQGNAGPYLGVDADSSGYIGAWAPSSQPFGGEVKRFKIYNESLTTNQVLSNYKNVRKRFEGLDNYYDHTTDGGGWIRFWWYTGVGWPGHETEALGHPFGTFDSSSHYGFQRLPEGLAKEQVELLAKDGDGNILKWDFASPSVIAQYMWDSFTVGTQGSWRQDGDPFNPEVIAGNKPNPDQDAWKYRDSEGVVSFLLDDDGCDCQSTLNAGHAMCGGGWNQTFAQPDGAYLRYGVDTLYDGGCRGPVPERTLELFYRLK